MRLSDISSDSSQETVCVVKVQGGRYASKLGLVQDDCRTSEYHTVTTRQRWGLWVASCFSNNVSFRHQNTYSNVRRIATGTELAGKPKTSLRLRRGSNSVYFGSHGMFYEPNRGRY
jgi:hypothetical protein